jgi:transcriptional regulator of arginine metabolism
MQKGGIMSRSNDLTQAIKALLLQENMQTHEEIADILKKQGYNVNQSTISRLLRKMGAIKGLNAELQQVYLLPKETSTLPPTLALSRLIRRIDHNEQLIIIHTTPGSANVIARMLDLHSTQCQILGTIAGDDTILIVPNSVSTLNVTISEIKNLFRE